MLFVLVSINEIKWNNKEMKEKLADLLSDRNRKFYSAEYNLK